MLPKARLGPIRFPATATFRVRPPEELRWRRERDMRVFRNIFLSISKAVKFDSDSIQIGDSNGITQYPDYAGLRVEEA